MKKILFLSLCFIVSSAFTTVPSKGRKVPAVVSMVLPCETLKPSKYVYYLLVNSTEQQRLGKAQKKTNGYLLRVQANQMKSVKASLLSEFSAINTSALLSRIRNSVSREITSKIRGASMRELDQAKLDNLLGGRGMRLSGTSLFADNGDDFIKGVSGATGAMLGVAGKFGASVGPAELVVAGTGAEIAGVVVAGVGVFYGAKSATTALLNATGANEGYTLGDLIYDIWDTFTGESDPEPAPADSGTPLPDDFGNSSDPGRSIGVLIALGLSSNQAFGNHIVLRPTTLSGTPIADGDTYSNLNLLLYFDAMFGGFYFKLVEKGLNARKNGASTPNPINDSNTTVDLSTIKMDIRGCPPANVNLVQYNSFFSAKANTLAIKRK